MLKVKSGNLKSELDLKQKLKALTELGRYILGENTVLNEIIHTASLYNRWFSPHNIRYALKAIAENFLEANKLNDLISKYNLPTNNNPKRIGIVMAGNIPLAGFHDLLCVIITGNIALIKQSSKDCHLLPHLMEKLCDIEPEFRNKFEFAEQLKNFDAVIATGSNNSSRYFEYYFGKYPHIIRKNRNSVAVLTGKETNEELQKLGDDIFLYFGLGCRSVSKLFIPLGYDFNALLKPLETFQFLMSHNGYKNNFDYNLTLHIMNKTPDYFTSDILLLQENKLLSSPIATLNFEYYNNLDELKLKLESAKNDIQCVVSSCLENSVPFGDSQKPQLCDYADGVDTIEFILSLDSGI